ncbi:hypothetical protein CFOL_v3_26562 [Cephalotus follicularis]|uniref:Uncharacterized protein n=1 Tax=Cephalotus follicularis TaxID=3775 RepID=A0A1Q3CSJ9_CEPFO|nr:hypothetical protein CFOL_v3_26562 [Cephalotus follicularis]
MDARQGWSVSQLWTHCFQSNIRALNDLYLLYGSARDDCELIDQLKAEVTELKQSANAAHAQLEEVLGAQKAILEDKRKALEALDKAQEVGENLVRTNKRLNDALMTSEQELSRIRETEAARTQAMADKALADFKASAKFQSALAKAVVDFKGFQRF